MSWDTHPVVLRDEARYNASCRSPTELRPASSLARVLVVDARCVCISNGIGNLFGDYIVWFLVAALTGRRLFVNWKDTLSDGTVANLSEAECLSASVGACCWRTHARFDLAEHFVAVGGTSWRWTPTTRGQVAAYHGGAPAEALFLAGTPTSLSPHERGDPTAVPRAAAATGGRAAWECDELLRALQGATALVTVRFHAGGSVGLLPRCTSSAATRIFPQGEAAAALAHEAARRADAAGAEAAAAELRRGEGHLGASRLR